MAAVVLACVSAVLFGGLTVMLRYALRRRPDPELGAVVTTVVAAAVCALLALIAWDGTLSPGELLPFALAGTLSPGAAQLLFTHAVQQSGPARTSVAVGTAPLISVAIALVFLDEPLHAALILGALLIVLGSVALIGERIRPDWFRGLGIALAFVASALFATRDNIIRWLSGDTPVAPLAAATVTLLAGLVLVVGYVLARRGRAAIAAFDRPLVATFWMPGVLFGLSYAALFEAYYRGRVTVVSPLIATESLWGVLLAALIIGRSELIGRRLVIGAALIVAGGVLIGVTR